MSNANNRADLAEKMEIIGRVFEIDGMTDLLKKFEPTEDADGKKKPIGTVRFNAVVIQISALLLKHDKELSDRIIAMSLEESDEKIQELDDGSYAQALRNALIRDVMGFFASSQPSGGPK